MADENMVDSASDSPCDLRAVADQAPHAALLKRCTIDPVFKTEIEQRIAALEAYLDRQ